MKNFRRIFRQKISNTMKITKKRKGKYGKTIIAFGAVKKK